MHKINAIKRDKGTKHDNFEVSEAGNKKTIEAMAKSPEAFCVDTIKVATNKTASPN